MLRLGCHGPLPNLDRQLDHWLFDVAALASAGTVGRIR